MNYVLNLLVFLLVLGIIGGAGWFIIQKFRLPEVALWIFGAILLLFLVFFLAGAGPRVVFVV